MKSEIHGTRTNGGALFGIEHALEECVPHRRQPVPLLGPLNLPDVEPHASCDIHDGERGGEQADRNRRRCMSEELDRYAYRREDDECRRNCRCHDSPCLVSHVRHHLPQSVLSYTRGAYIADICECPSTGIPPNRSDSPERAIIAPSSVSSVRGEGRKGAVSRSLNHGCRWNDCRRYRCDSMLASTDFISSAYLSGIGSAGICAVSVDRPLCGQFRIYRLV